jgi:predicted O-methyltransferase YrrM
MGDSVSQYLEIDFAADIQLNFDKFKLGSANILNRSSTSKEASEFISSGNWNLVYIDGSHDYQDVLSDYRNSISGLAPNGIVVLDDSSLFLDQIKDYKAFQGHPGPSNICMKYALNELEHFLSVGHLNFFRRN